MAFNPMDVTYVLNECRIKCPGASDSGIKEELWGVVKEFLQDTNSWIEHQKLLVTAGVQCYPVVPRDGGQIIRLVGVINGNRQPVPAAMPQFGTLMINCRIDTTSIDVAPTDHTTAANHPWRFCIIKNIAFPATRDTIPIAPDFIMSRYAGTIVDGILGKMMMQQAKSYTNLALAKYHLQRFRDGIGIARTDAWSQNLFGGQRWQFPQTFATHSQRTYSAPWPAESF